MTRNADMIDEGYAAFARGRSIRDCPHANSTDAAYWRTGWNNAHDDLAVSEAECIDDYDNGPGYRNR